MQEIIASVDHIKDCPWYDRGFCKHGPLCRHRHTRRVICVNYLVGFCPEGPSCKFMHPRFELPMGTTEQPPLPQQTQPPTKFSFLCVCMVFFGQQLLPSSPELSFRPTFLGQAIAEALFLLIMQERSRPLFFPVPIGSPRARVFRSKTVLCNSFQQSNNPPLQRSSSLIQLTSQNSSPNQQRAPQVIGVMQSQNSSAGNRGPRPLEQVTCYKCGEKGHYANRCTKGHLAFLSGQ